MAVKTEDVSIETMPDSSRNLITRREELEFQKNQKKKKLSKRMTKAEILVYGIPPDYFGRVRS